jgi:hypothetical protein
MVRQGNRILRCSGEHRQQVVFVETTEKPFLSQANLVYMLLSQEIESSALNVTSNDQCSLFSLSQCWRIIATKAVAERARLER